MNVRLAYDLGQSLFYAFPFSFVAFGFVRMLSTRSKGQKAPTASELFFQRSNYIVMGWASFLFVFTVLRDLAGLVAHFVYSDLSFQILSEQGAQRKRQKRVFIFSYLVILTVVSFSLDARRSQGSQVSSRIVSCCREDVDLRKH